MNKGCEERAGVREFFEVSARCAQRSRRTESENIKEQSVTKPSSQHSHGAMKRGAFAAAVVSPDELDEHALAMGD